MSSLFANALDFGRLSGAPLIFGAAFAVAGYIYHDQVSAFYSKPWIVGLLHFFAGVGVGFWLLP
jgi:hypothetical protein